MVVCTIFFDLRYLILFVTVFDVNFLEERGYADVLLLTKPVSWLNSYIHRYWCGRLIGQDRQRSPSLQCFFGAVLPRR